MPKIEGLRSNEERIPFSGRMRAELMQRISDIAEENDATKTSVIEYLITKGLEQL